MTTTDYLWPHLRDLPYFRATLRAVEARFYQDLEMVSPTLDLGCGDGHFASIAFERKVEVGVDPWWEPIHEANRRNVYQHLVQGDAGKMPFPDGFFASAFSNSVLEHIPHLDTVIADTSRVMRPGGYFYFCVPNHQFNHHLSIGQGLTRMGMRSLSNAYQRFFDRIARHQHLDSPEVWEKRLVDNGFALVKWWHYFSPEALHMMEWGHLFGLPSLFWRKVTGRWNLVESPWNFTLTRKLVERYYNEASPNPQGVCTFYIARKV